jgi:hypothetical protein
MLNVVHSEHSTTGGLSGFVLMRAPFVRRRVLEGYLDFARFTGL